MSKPSSCINCMYWNVNNKRCEAGAWPGEVGELEYCDYRRTIFEIRSLGLLHYNNEIGIKEDKEFKNLEE